MSATQDVYVGGGAAGRAPFPHMRYAGRYALGHRYDVVLAKQGVRYALDPHGRGGSGSNTDSEEGDRDWIVVGGACSEMFSGANLAGVLQRAHDLEAEALAQLRRGHPATPLNTHTSVGVSPALGEFAIELARRAPWPAVRRSAAAAAASSSSGTDGANESAAGAANDGGDADAQRGTDADDRESAGGDAGKDGDDWFVTVQVEGASAVHAAFDVLLQLRALEGAPSCMQTREAMHTSGLAAVAALSYHGPGSTSFGSTQPLGEHARQIQYPAPALVHKPAGESSSAFFARTRRAFDAWLAANASRVAVLFVEPQWGSSALGQPWPTAELRHVVDSARAAGIKVCADEIMCGGGRHGQGGGELFLSAALGLEVDAVTFGKAIAGGVDPLSGVLFRRGGRLLRTAGSGVLQSHTFAGSSSRALVTAVEVLRRLDTHHAHVAEVGALLGALLQHVTDDPPLRGKVAVHGQGLLWGVTFPHLVDRRLCPDHAATVGSKCQSGGGSGGGGSVHAKDEEQYAAWNAARAATLRVFHEACRVEKVRPYFVLQAKQAGCLLTPVLDITPADATEAVRRLHAALLATFAAPLCCTGSSGGSGSSE